MQQTDETDPRHRPSFRLRLLLARLTVTFERAYPAFWPAFAVVVAFVVIAFLGLFERLPGLIHAALLLLFVLALGWTLWRGWRAWTAASVDEGMRRLEQDSHFRHDTLRALGDALPEQESADPATAALWRAHRRRLLATLDRVRLAPPRSSMPRRDPWAFRILAPLLLIVALVDGHGDYAGRLTSAFRPWQAVAGPHIEPTASLWITPPGYTRRPPLLAEQTAALAALDVPAGSSMLVQVHHLSGEEASGILVQLGDARLASSALGNDGAETKHDIDRPGRLSVQLADGHEIRGWDIKLIGDQPPTIAFADKPHATQRGVLRLDYDASDDYGLAEIAMDMVPPDAPEAQEHFSLAKPAAQPATIKSGAFLDLTAHPRAGLPVRLTLTATDGKGQVGHSQTIDLVLPERPFRHPLARAVIAQRKHLVAQPDDREEVAAGLANLAASPLAQSLGAGVPLSLYVAGHRTMAAQSAEDRKAVVAMLWDLALFIEDGGLSNAEREMRALQEKLQQALDQNAGDQELNKLMQELQEAMNRYLDELERKAMEQARSLTPEQRQQLEQMRAQSQMQAVDRQDLQDMLDRARQLMRNGAKDQARQMLSQLQDMLENLQAQAGQPQQPSPQEQSLSDLQKMIQMQQKLLDRSFDMQRQQNQQAPQMGEGDEQNDPMPGQQGQQSQGQQRGEGSQPGQQGGQQQSAQSAAEQEALRKALGELMRRMGEQGMEIPRALGQAEMQMRSARDNLQGSQPGAAADAQSQAVDLMQQGGQAMMEQMQQQAGGQPGMGRPNQGPPMVPGRQGRDPLGRAQYNNGGNDPQGATVPEEADMGRARDVLEQLYKRSGERNRPQIELDYYRRLLDRF